MAQTISLRTDAKTKKAAQLLAKAVGLSLNSLVNIWLRQVVINRHIEIKLPEASITPKLENLISQVDADIKSGKNLSPKRGGPADFIADSKRADSEPDQTSL